MSDEINHSTLKLLIEAGAVKTITALADADQWTLKVSFGESEKIVLAKNSGKARIWRKLDTLAKYLSGLGVIVFKINMQDYDPRQKTLTRPDSAATLKQAHRAHKTQQQEIAATEPTIQHIAESNNELSSDNIKANWEERRARILQQEDPRVK